ncbi:hypothetical protein JAAARDRAFT_137843 [Jaapia argillacea MUCL 33604]|uniref:Vacuolar protein sorting-associated protein 27 n=1 Tax=Jaapia argillacea MUCL 33604 TaxID=933084 RepID=A0A067PGS5_9AGAM|nr:hypothetical protein JAAARDRAFT_137843 [Jaapia argillacea MUCL 33604]
MASIGNWLWGTSQVDEVIDKATSELLPAGSEDIALNLEICDQIRSKAVPPKDAMRALKRRLNHKNPNVQILALILTDVCIKNGGDHFLVEVASREFMDNLVSILKMPALNLEVKNKILKLVQNWALAFEGKPMLRYVGEAYKTLQTEGFKFPPKDPAVTSSAMVDTQTAPDWIDSEVCLRCRTPFSFTNRKHHCRNCGQVFDQQCSAKNMPLPHFGITQEVRVCDGCYAKLTKNRDKSNDTKSHRHSSSRHRNAREFEDTELQRAIQLSLQETGAMGGYRPGYIPSQPSPSPWQPSSPPLIDRTTRPTSTPSIHGVVNEEEEDPDLRAAIEASLREASAPKPSAPVAVETPRAEAPPFAFGTSPAGYSASTSALPSVPALPNYDLELVEADAILTFSQTMDQVAQSKKDISRYPAVTELYDKANGLRPKLARSLDDSTRREQMLIEMNDKLSEAVKLYDRLLTEQVSHPPWRIAPVTAPYQPQQPVATPVYSPQYAAASTPSYDWRLSQAPQQVPADGPSYSQQQQQQPQQYASQVNGVQTTQQPSYSQQQMYQAQPQSPLASQQPEALRQQYEQSSRPFASSPRVSSPLATSSPYGPPQVTSPQSSAPASVYDPTPKSFSSQLPSVGQTTSSVLPQEYANSPQYSHPSVSRHNTFSAYPSASSPQQQQPYGISRPNPVSQPSAPPQQQPQQYQQQYMPAAPAPLPAFPVAPTSAPQPFGYGPSVPSGIEQEERKEALLIDL